MSVQSIENPAPIYNTSIFIPKLWSNTIKNTIATSNDTTDFIGDISLYTGTTLPSKFLWCNGDDFIESSYPELAVILNNYKQLSPTPSYDFSYVSPSSNAFTFSSLGLNTSPTRTRIIANINTLSGYKGGTFTIQTSLIYVINGSFSKALSASSTLQIRQSVSNIVFKLYLSGVYIKDIPYTTTTTTADLNNVGFNVVNNGSALSSVSYTVNQFVTTYNIELDFEYGDSGNYNVRAVYNEFFIASITSGSLQSFSITANTFINTLSGYSNSFAITAGTGTISAITTIPDTYEFPNITYTPILIPYTPDFRNRNIINYASSCYTTNSVPQVLYNSTCTSISGNRTMNVNQLETHIHGYNISPTEFAVTGISTGTAPRTFNAFISRANLLDSVGITSDNTLTQGTISTIPSAQTDLYSPFVVVNYIIRALL